MEPLGTLSLTGYSYEGIPEPPEVVYFWEKKKEGQICDLNIHSTYVCDKDQDIKPYQKLWIYQVPQLK